jgi:TPR repeat protein
VKADPNIAVHNYQTAAERYNHRRSEFRLGMHYLHGSLGLEKDASKAFSYLEPAAKAGYAEAQYLLGMMYRNGQAQLANTRSLRGLSSAEISRNKKEAFRWIRKAAVQNMHTAITQIANCYEEGVGTPVNYALATEYYEIATNISSKHLATAQQTYARFLHKNGKYEKALEMYLYASGLERSPLNTYPPSAPVSRIAKRMVALLYLDEKDTTTPYKPKEAFELLNSLASSGEGDADAHYWIAVCYEEGVPNVVDIDLCKSFDHYMTSANLGSSDSQFQVH